MSSIDAFAKSGQDLLDRLDARVSRPVVPISAHTVRDARRKLELAVVSLQLGALVGFWGWGAANGSLPTVTHSLIMIGVGSLNIPLLENARQRVVEKWMNFKGKDAPASVDEVYDVVDLVEKHPTIRPLVARAIAATQAKTLTSGNARDIIKTTKKAFGR